MSNLAPEHDEELDEQEQKESRRSRAKEREEQQARLAQAERELAVFKADLPGLTAKQREALATLHKGDDLTPDALKATATEYGFITQADETVPQSEIQSHDTAARASTDAPSSAGPDVYALMSQANTPEEIMAIAQANGVPTSWDEQ